MNTTGGRRSQGGAACGKLALKCQYLVNSLGFESDTGIRRRMTLGRGVGQDKTSDSDINNQDKHTLLLW